MLCYTKRRRAILITPSTLIRPPHPPLTMNLLSVQLVRVGCRHRGYTGATQGPLWPLFRCIPKQQGSGAEPRPPPDAAPARPLRMRHRRAVATHACAPDTQTPQPSRVRAASGRG